VSAVGRPWSDVACGLTGLLRPSQAARDMLSDDSLQPFGVGFQCGVYPAFRRECAWLQRRL